MEPSSWLKLKESRRKLGCTKLPFKNLKFIFSLSRSLFISSYYSFIVLCDIAI